MTSLHIEPVLLEAVIRGTTEGLAMTGLRPPPVGASRFQSAGRPISVMIAMVGANNGTCTLSVGERAMLHLAGKLIGEERTRIDEETVDALGEIANMVAGRIQELLRGTPFATDSISVPSLVIGQSYQVFYARGMHTASVDFELEGLPITDLRERFLTTTLSLMRRIASAA